MRFFFLALAVLAMLSGALSFQVRDRDRKYVVSLDGSATEPLTTDDRQTRVWLWGLSATVLRALCGQRSLMVYSIHPAHHVFRRVTSEQHESQSRAS